MKNPREVFNYNKLTRGHIEWLEAKYLKYWNDLSLQGDKYGWWEKLEKSEKIEFFVNDN